MTEEEFTALASSKLGEGTYEKAIAEHGEEIAFIILCTSCIAGAGNTLSDGCSHEHRFGRKSTATTEQVNEMFDLITNATTFLRARYEANDNNFLANSVDETPAEEIAQAQAAALARALGIEVPEGPAQPAFTPDEIAAIMAEENGVNTEAANDTTPAA